MRRLADAAGVDPEADARGVDGARHGAHPARHRPRHRARPHRRRRRRIGLRQVEPRGVPACACCRRTCPRIGGEIVFDGVDLLALDEPAMNAYRGTRIAMIFQDPMTALNPLFTVGTHLVDVLRRRHPGISRGRRAGSARSRRSRASASPTRRCGSRPIRTSSRAACASA